MRARAGAGTRGIALVVVLWGLALLGTIAMSFGVLMRTEAQAARNAADATRAYFQARTGINRAIAMLSWMPPDNVARETIAEKGEDAGYEVRVESESGKIDVNLAPERLLKDALAASGLSGDEAESLGDAILDWRESGDRPRPHGAKAADYAGLPEAVAPRGAPLRTLEELRYVRGVTPALYRDLLARIFTVDAKSPQVNVNAAPPAVLGALGFSAAAVDNVVVRRKETPFGSVAELSALLGPKGIPAAALPYLATASASNVYTIAARGIADGRDLRAVRCRVELGGTAGPGVRVVHWEDAASSPGEAR